MKYCNLEIEVTNADIIAHCNDKEYCPIVEAIDRATKYKTKEIAVGRAHVYIDGLGYRLPSDAIGLVNALYNKPNLKLIKAITFKLGDLL